MKVARAYGTCVTMAPSAAAGSAVAPIPRQMMSAMVNVDNVFLIPTSFSMPLLAAVTWDLSSLVQEPGEQAIDQEVLKTASGESQDSPARMSCIGIHQRAGPSSELRGLWLVRLQVRPSPAAASRPRKAW
jgi:hypothetical protein